VYNFRHRLPTGIRRRGVIITANCNNVARERLADFGDSAKCLRTKGKKGSIERKKMMDQIATVIGKKMRLRLTNRKYFDVARRGYAPTIHSRFIHRRILISAYVHRCFPRSYGAFARTQCDSQKDSVEETEVPGWRKTHASAPRSHVRRIEVG